MSVLGEVIVGLVIFVGLLGIVIPVLPGSLIIAVAIAVWAGFTGGLAWAVFGIAVVLIVIGEVVKYLIAGRTLKTHGIPNITIIVGALAGIVGFFVVPVIGLFLGFVVGAFASELVRRRDVGVAWSAMWVACKAALMTIGIELCGALLAAGTWLVGAIVL